MDTKETDDRRMSQFPTNVFVINDRDRDEIIKRRKKKREQQEEKVYIINIEFGVQQCTSC